ncbi:MAG: hemolysin family protein [Planctomycetota bacterium]
MIEDEPDPGRESGHHPESSSGLFLVALFLTALQPVGLLLVAIGCLVLAFFLALFENALQHHSRVRLTEEANRLDLTAALDQLLLQEEELIFASKIGRGLTQIVAVAMIVVFLVETETTGFVLAVWAVGGAAVYLLFNVAAPYFIGKRGGHAILLRGLVPYSRAIALLRPVAALLQNLANRLMRTRPLPSPSEETKDELLSVAEEGAREGTLDASVKEMIEGVMDLSEVSADEVMTPRTDLVCLPVDATVQEAIARAQERGLSRLPVYRGTPDEIVGVLYMKDLLPYLGRGEVPAIEAIVRRPLFVPQSKNAGELLAEMKAGQVHLAIVLDEYGGTAGIVTIEDILEEIVGEIADEHEEAAVREVVPIDQNAATVEGRTHVDDLNKALDLDVPESEEYETVGGLLFTLMGRVPAAGEHYEVNGIRFTILDADERRINRVKVTKAGA